MKNIIKIFAKDIKNIFTNWVATVVVIALMVLPSLYSLFNIKAAWDPYGNTNGIKVAIVNDDKGTVFKDNELNLGNELVDKLKDNDKIGWTFVDKQTAKNGVLMEKYYASIEIPEDFSEDVTSLVGKNITRPKLIYTVNEKKNAIAPKITDAGVKTVKSQIDESIIKTVSGIIFKASNEIGIDIQNNRPELRNIMNEIYKLDDNMPELESLINEAIDGTKNTSDLLDESNKIIPTISDTLDTTNYFLKNSQEFLDSTEGDLSDISPVIKENLSNAESGLDSAETQLGNIDDKILPEVAKKTLLLTTESAKASNKSIDNIRTKLKSIQKFLDKLSDIEISVPKFNDETDSEAIKKLQDEANKQKELLESGKDNVKDASSRISKIIDRLDTISNQNNIVINKCQEQLDKLNNGENIDIQTIKDTRKILDDVHTLVSNTLDNYDSEIQPTIQNAFASIRKVSDSGSTLLEQGKGIIPDMENIINVFKNTSNLSQDELIKLKNRFPEIKENVHKLASKLKEIDDSDKIDELLDMMTNNWEEQSSFMADPVEIQDNRLFPWPNYGSASTPFYTVLCLWIGGYILSILLGTEEHSFEEGIELKNYQVYFGKMLLFLFIGIGQGIMASVGALYLLRVYAVHPVMYILFSIFVNIVFTTIIYTAVSVFGNAGIIFGVVLLVMQVAGTSGNFPIEVNPTMFKDLFPFMPFTYAISGMRQIMAGIVYSILLKDIGILLIFMFIFIVIGLVLKKPANKKNEKFIKKLKESKLMN